MRCDLGVRQHVRLARRSPGGPVRSLFVNLPVADVAAARAFYAALGLTIDERFSDEQTVCVVIAENIRIMLVAPPRFELFINGEVADPATTEVLLAITATSRAEADDLLARALAAGATPWKPAMEQGPMYSVSFRDLDGHVLELVHLPG
jgi:predicted lactoylglutathione lyase